jgi:hypothetical protein
VYVDEAMEQLKAMGENVKGNEEEMATEGEQNLDIEERTVDLTHDRKIL